jgi:hypothetical protein
MPTKEYKEAEQKWFTAKAKYDEAFTLYEAISKLLEQNLAELDKAFSEFSVQQAIYTQGLKKAHVKEVKE